MSSGDLEEAGMRDNVLIRERQHKKVGAGEAGAKRKYDSGETKRRLFKAAINVFSKQGYDAATTREIAKQANVNLSLIPRYFENKLGLFFAIIKDFHQHLVSTPPYPPADTLQGELTQFFRFRMEFAHKYKKLLRLSISRAILDPKVRAELGALAKVGMPWLNSRLEKLRAEGKIRKDTDIEKTCLLIGGITFAMSMYTEIAFSMDPEHIQRVLDEAVVTVCEGLRPKM
jgi:TetR/AcrR family transcriptional regulator, regulator of cefoperazone and chloramphenicol sensitivity